jgi:hypothetical protein
MNLKRTATIVVVGAAVAAWWSAAMTPNIRPSVVPPSEVAPRRSAELASEISRLHERLRPEATPNQAVRNPFAFRSARPSRPSPIVERPPALGGTAAASMPIAEPPLKLAGIAEDIGAAGPVRTAIISGSGQLFLVKEGEAVTSRYRVVAISPDVVELKDVDSGATRRLALR